MKFSSGGGSPDIFHFLRRSIRLEAIHTDTLLLVHELLRLSLHNVFDTQFRQDGTRLATQRRAFRGQHGKVHRAHPCHDFTGAFKGPPLYLRP